MRLPGDKQSSTTARNLSSIPKMRSHKKSRQKSPAPSLHGQDPLPVFGRRTEPERLNKFFDVNRLRSFRSTLHVETHMISLTQRAKSIRRNGAVVDENVSLLLGLNETITLFVVEPFHAPFRHLPDPFCLQFCSHYPRVRLFKHSSQNPIRTNSSRPFIGPIPIVGLLKCQELIGSNACPLPHLHHSSYPNG